MSVMVHDENSRIASRRDLSKTTRVRAPRVTIGSIKLLLVHDDIVMTVSSAHSAPVAKQRGDGLADVDARVTIRRARTGRTVSRQDGLTV
jgi:hypothetical protein